MRASWARLLEAVWGLSQGPEGPRSEAARTRALGRRGEREAARHLRGMGYRVIARNAVTRVGEADLVALTPDRAGVVIVEVKARERREGSATHAPEVNITASKRATLRAVATVLARANGWRRERVRIDVVAVEFEPGGRRVAALRHHEGVV